MPTSRNKSFSLQHKFLKFQLSRGDFLPYRVQQQRISLYSVLELIRETAIIEGTNPIEIAVLTLQLLSNEVGNRKIPSLPKI